MARSTYPWGDRAEPGLNGVGAKVLKYEYSCRTLACCTTSIDQIAAIAVEMRVPASPYHHLDCLARPTHAEICIGMWVVWVTSSVYVLVAVVAIDGAWCLALGCECSSRLPPVPIAAFVVVA